MLRYSCLDILELTYGRKECFELSSKMSMCLHVSTCEQTYAITHTFKSEETAAEGTVVCLAFQSVLFFFFFNLGISSFSSLSAYRKYLLNKSEWVCIVGFCILLWCPRWKYKMGEERKTTGFKKTFLWVESLMLLLVLLGLCVP